MEPTRRRVAIKRHAQACLLAAGLALLALAHANPFASPDPPPPPANDIPLPPDLIDQLPPLPLPSPDAPVPEPEPTPEERLAQILPRLTRPTLTLTPQTPRATLGLGVPDYRPSVPQPTYLEDAAALTAAITLNPHLQLQQSIALANVELLAVILSGTPRAILHIGDTARIITYGDLLPGGLVRLSAIHETGVILTYDGVSLELPLGGAQ